MNTDDKAKADEAFIQKVKTLIISTHKSHESHEVPKCGLCGKTGHTVIPVMVRIERRRVPTPADERSFAE
jgi:hypothetical protein